MVVSSKQVSIWSLALYIPNICVLIVCMCVGMYGVFIVNVCINCVHVQVICTYL